jgi:hypothetical protein
MGSILFTFLHFYYVIIPGKQQKVNANGEEKTKKPPRIFWLAFFFFKPMAEM